MSDTGRMGIVKLREHTNDRDRAILHSVRRFRFLTTRHIYELHFALHASYVSGIRACTRVLARLESHRFITRLPRPVGGSGGGSTSTIWSIGPAGDRLLRSAHPDEEKTRTRSYEPTLNFLKHTLAIADLRVDLERHARTGSLQILEVQTEPANWRRFVSPSGRVRTLKPDLSTSAVVGQDELFHFWEVDLGSEPIHRLVTQCHIYQQYFDTGVEQATLGVFPQVVWLLGDARRRKRLRQAIASDATLLDELFYISRSGDPLDAILFDPEGD